MGGTVNPGAFGGSTSPSALVLAAYGEAYHAWRGAAQWTAERRRSFEDYAREVRTAAEMEAFAERNLRRAEAAVKAYFGATNG